MKKHIIMNVNLAICLIIFFGFLSTALYNFNTYSKIIDDDIKNISMLTSTNIYSEINNELTKPIFVSLTMANDSFLINWLSHEERVYSDEKYLQKLQDYLLGIKEKYQYDSVFFISQKTKYYYHYEGILKTISKEDFHDNWYYTFISSNQSYALDVDNDEAKNNELTVFVNCRVVDSSGSLLGVVGVGVKISQLQTMLKNFEDEYGLEAYLIDPRGIVQVHTDINKIEKVNIFEQKIMADLRDKITSNKDTLVTSLFKQDNIKGYVISRYVNEMGWFLVVKKDTSILVKSFHQQVFHDSLIMAFILILLIMLSTFCISRYKKHITKLVKTDELTKLPNRRAYNEELYFALNHFTNNQKVFQVFVFDIDFFKAINDNYGHHYGDLVISDVANMAAETVGKKGMVARWGGDEFSGILYGTMEEALKIVDELVQNARALENNLASRITISIGLTQINESDGIDSVLIRADSGLYEAKAAGRNQYIVK